MTRFERDLQKAIAGNEIEVITARRVEIKTLKDELGKCKNNFRSHALFQEITRLKRELVNIEAQY